MSTYLKNIAGYKHSQLKSKSYDEIPKLFDKEMKRVNTFVDINSEVVKGSKTRTEESFKRAGDELESDKSKKQKIDKHVEAKKDDDLEEEEIKKHMEIIVKEGRKGFYHLIRADGSSKRYSLMIRMLYGSGPKWLFDIDALTKSMNYKLVVAGNQSNGNADTKACDDTCKARMEIVPGKDYILLPLWTVDLPFSQSSKSSLDAGFKPSGDDEKRLLKKEPRKRSIELMLIIYASLRCYLSIQHDDEDIEEEVYVCQPPGFEDPDFPDRVYKVEKALCGLHQAPRACYYALSLRRWCIKSFQMSSMGELTFFLGLQVKQKKDGIFISQDKYVTKILKKFGFTDVKTTSIPIETQKLFLNDEDGEEVDVHLYRSMIGSLMYLTSSRPDIMFTVCACARYQVNQKISHLHAVKRIFGYLKGQPKLGLWYPKDSPFDLVAYTDSDYAGASLDRKSTTGGCQFLGSRLISWQCKKQTVVANSITEAEYVAASSCYGQVL
ncbi:uncharacterized mitochondrial protein-like protein [Tanacetum coccineum]